MIPHYACKQEHHHRCLDLPGDGHDTEEENHTTKFSENVTIWHTCHIYSYSTNCWC